MVLANGGRDEWNNPKAIPMMNSAVTAAAPVNIGRSGGWMLRHSSIGVAVMAARADLTAGSCRDTATGGTARLRSCTGGCCIIAL